MARKVKDINSDTILEELKNSFTEEDILKNLIQLVKLYKQEQYIEIIYSNPFYKSLIPDIQKEILDDLERVAKSINDEISAIDTDLKKIGNKDSEKQLKLIKKDCLSLIYEIDERKKEIEMLSQY
jgi:hypothetical protein